MAGYGFYDTEEEGSELITGAGAIPKKKFIVERVQAASGRKYPRKVGYTIEYASKYLYNKNIAANNPWLKFVNADPTIKSIRSKMGERMRELALEYNNRLQASDPQKYELLQQAKKKRIQSIQKYGTLSDRLEKVMAKYISDHPTPESGLAYALQNKLVPNRSAARIFLKLSII
ncbi:MAG: hypothetical protein NZZ41_07155 [Candidatus Dojkabacteria bacterium]|nr:hypothetical protein [Candidatus Dojkabacteria bacterium]